MHQLEHRKKKNKETVVFLWKAITTSLRTRLEQKQNVHLMSILRPFRQSHHVSILTCTYKVNEEWTHTYHYFFLSEKTTFPQANLMPTI